MTYEPQFTLRQLAHFVAVADHGSVQAAAAASAVSQSALSHGLSALERAVGSQLLLRRQSHGATLTAAGRQLAGRARILLREAEHLLELSESSDDIAGVVRVGASATLAPMVLPKLIRAVTDRFPRLRIETLIGTGDDSLQRLRASEIDAAFIAGRVSSDYETLPLFRLQAHAILPLGHPLADREQVDLRELADEPYVEMDTDSARRFSREVFVRSGVEPIIGHRAGTVELVRGLIAQGLGYGVQILPPGSSRNGSDGLVVLPLIDGENLSSPLLLATLGAVRVSPQTEAVLKIAEEIYSLEP